MNIIESSISQSAHWTREFLSTPLGLGASGGVTGGASILAVLKAIGEYAAPIGIILGVAVTVYSIYLNYHKRKDERKKHEAEMELISKKINSIQLKQK